MDPDTFRGDVGVEGADVYWRRRVSVLTGMLVVVAVVAWACSSASGRPDETAAAVKAAPSDRLVVSLPAGPAPKTPAVSGAVAGQPSPSASAGVSPSPGKPRRPGDPCDEKDLVLALQTGQDVYGKGVTPSFLLTVVSTSKVECTVDVGPRTLEMRVLSGGDRVWSTADCVAGDGVDKQLLERGIPYVRSIRWDRHRSGSTCAGKRSPADPGTYVATAHSGRLKSPKVVFHLR